MTRLRKYLANGLLMTLVALALRGLGVTFNAYITKTIGAEALGLYTLLGSVYSFALTLALSGINLTTTRLVSDGIGEKRKKELLKKYKKKAHSRCASRCKNAYAMLSFLGYYHQFYSSYSQNQFHLES